MSASMPSEAIYSQSSRLAFTAPKADSVGWIDFLNSEIVQGN